MSIVTWPDGLSIPAEFSLGQQRYDMTESSDSTGADAARLLGPPRWTVSLRSIEAMTLSEAGLWEAMLLQLRGRVNHLALHDPVRAAPRGTLRGAPLLNAAASAGATSITLVDVRTAANLLVKTRALGATEWTASNATVTDNTTAAPDGSTTADTVTDASGAATGYIDQQAASAVPDSASYTGSIYIAKTVGGTAPSARVTVLFDGGGTPVSSSIVVNTDTGAILSGTGTVESVDASWWRAQLTRANNATGNTTVELRVYPAHDTYGNSAGSAAATGSAILWGAQLEAGTAATAYAGATLAAGDWLQLGSGVGTSQLVKVVADATESHLGLMLVTFEPPLREDIADATAVTWDRPVAYYKQTSAPQWGYRARLSTGYALDLLESWTP